ncbi:hypothetical protein [Lacticaseibacillus sp. N501-2]|uniref:hypothetical protein n=1 Tax=Lacticaseibacillus salsurae TaxID=3367729 RepID=UPI0038B3EF80
MANYATHPKRKEIGLVCLWLRSRSHYCLYLFGRLLLRCAELQRPQSHQVGSFLEPASAGSQRTLAEVNKQKAALTLSRLMRL